MRNIFLILFSLLFAYMLINPAIADAKSSLKKTQTQFSQKAKVKQPVKGAAPIKTPPKTGSSCSLDKCTIK